jgi:hypothetical protein
MVWWTASFNHQYLLLVEVWMTTFVLTGGPSGSCYSSVSCMIRIESVLVVFVQFISTLELNISWLYNSALPIFIMLLINMFPSMSLTLSPSTLQYVWILHLPLVDKVKVKSTIDHIDVAAQVAWTSISYHFTNVLRIGSCWMEMITLLTTHII